jgi:hypothetical protein
MIAVTKKYKFFIGQGFGVKIRKKGKRNETDKKNPQ